MPGDPKNAMLPGRSDPDSRLDLRSPTVADGAALWRLAAESKVLDVNSSYAYLLWCRDFARSSVVATVDDEAVGFVTGFVRPDQPDTLMVWQVAVDSEHRGRGLARTMLDHLVDRHLDESVAWLEATVTPDNQASARLFASFAEARGTDLVREPVFAAELFPDEHESEVLFRIGSLA
jgi:diaminobutyrate-2-oxoglutarate transaminase